MITGVHQQLCVAAGRNVRNGAVPQPGEKAGEYSFLLENGIDKATLERACRLARRWGCAPHQVLVANGWMIRAEYYRALARICGAGFIERSEAPMLVPAALAASPRQCLRSGLLRRMRAGKYGLVLTPGRAEPYSLKTTIAERFGPFCPVAIATPDDLRETVIRHQGARLMDKAVHGLARRHADESAATRVSTGQRLSLAAFTAVTCVGIALSPYDTLRALAGVATLFFSSSCFYASSPAVT